MVKHPEAALRAIHLVIIQAQVMAFEERPHAEIAEVLDSAEYLPSLLLEDDDRSALFRQTLVELQRFGSGFARPLDAYDRGGEDRPPDR